ncbi:MAG: hypothetical protein IPO35_11175 [Uliginosibacterium sp.]|nr:hypothetical protein [Uliginosibacterium sp.]
MLRVIIVAKELINPAIEATVDRVGLSVTSSQARQRYRQRLGASSLLNVLAVSACILAGEFPCEKQPPRQPGQRNLATGSEWRRVTMARPWPTACDIAATPYHVVRPRGGQGE